MSEAPKRTGSPAATFVTILMDVLIAVAVVVVAHMVIVFFGQLAVQPWAKQLVPYTGKLVVPVGAAPIKTPYGGVFDVNAAATVLILLAGEWVLGMVRRSV